MYRLLLSKSRCSPSSRSFVGFYNNVFGTWTCSDAAADDKDDDEFILCLCIQVVEETAVWPRWDWHKNIWNKIKGTKKKKLVPDNDEQGYHILHNSRLALWCTLKLKSWEFYQSLDYYHCQQYFFTSPRLAFHIFRDIPGYRSLKYLVTVH